MKWFRSIIIFLLIITGCTLQTEEEPKSFLRIINETTKSTVAIKIDVDQKEYKKIQLLAQENEENWVIEYDQDLQFLIEQYRLYDEYSIGSGLIISKSGLVITCSHVITETKNVKGQRYAEFANGKRYKLSNFIVNPEVDLAIGKIEEENIKFIPLKLETTRWPYRGEEVILMGSSGPIKYGFIEGKVTWSYMETTIEDRKFLTIPISGAVIPGFSGGPVVNKYGRLIGITVAQFERGVFSFAIPAKSIKELINTTQQNREK